MTAEQIIKSSIKAMAKEVVSNYPVFTAEVRAIDGDRCDLFIDGSLEVKGCKLRAVINNNNEQVLVVPKTGSYVLAIDMSEGKMRDIAVFKYSEVQEINIKIGEQSFVMNKDGVVFNDGNNNGLIKIQELTNKINDLITKFNNHTHTGVIVAVAGNATGTPGSTAVPTSTATPFNKNDYEDTKVKH
jgi:hypothetical protein